MQPLIMFVAGRIDPARMTTPSRIQANVDAMTEASLALSPARPLTVMGEWFALPLIEAAGSTAIGDAAFEEIFHPMADESWPAATRVLRDRWSVGRRRPDGRGGGASREACLPRPRRHPRDGLTATTRAAPAGPEVLP